MIGSHLLDDFDTLNFKSPPVVEVVLSAQFVPLPLFTAPYIGLLWQKFKQEYPVSQQHAPLGHITEAFGVTDLIPPAMNFQFLTALPTPRCFFLSKDGGRIIQIQSDRIIQNWRKIGSEPYPRYEQLCSEFELLLSKFEEFIRSEKLGEVTFDQAEVTYLNNISSDEWSEPSQLDEVLSFWPGFKDSEFLGHPEGVQLASRHIIKLEGQAVGRLHIELNTSPAMSITGGTKPGIILQLTSRLRPKGYKREDVIKRLNLGRTWIVSAFKDMTTQSARTVWGEE